MMHIESLKTSIYAGKNFKIPAIGFGTYKLKGAKGLAAMKHALKDRLQYSEFLLGLRNFSFKSNQYKVRFPLSFLSKVNLYLCLFVYLLQSIR